MTHERLMRKTLRLARKGCGRVSPNPMVGAVIVQDGQIVGQGYHKRFGDVHAEVAAINSTTADLGGGTLYVNLEPCSHTGKQPPCVERIMQSGIGRVVVGALDPNPLVNGRGVEALRGHGVEVTVGVCESACRELNAGFFRHVVTGYPLVTLKIAQTLDGRIAAEDGSSKWVSGVRSRERTHKLRAENDAILAGIGTVLSDDPSLTVRHVRGENPLRVIVDSGLRIPLSAAVLNDELAGQTVVACASDADSGKVSAVRGKGAEVWEMRRDNSGRIDLRTLCQRLGERGVVSLLVEGGSRIFSSFLKERLADRLQVFIAPKLLGSGISAVQSLSINSLSDCLQFSDMSAKKVGEDILITASLSD